MKNLLRNILITGAIILHVFAIDLRGQNRDHRNLEPTDDFVWGSLASSTMQLKQKVDLNFQVAFPENYEDEDEDEEEEEVDEYQQYYFSNVGNVLYSPDDGPGAVSAIHSASLEPNRVYTFWIRGSETYKPQTTDIIDLNIKFLRISGYEVYVNNVSQPYISSALPGSEGWASFSVMVKPVSIASGSWLSKDVANFSFPLGASPTGDNLGSVSINVEGVATNQVTRDKLNEIASDLYPGIVTSGSTSGSLDWVKSPQFEIVFSSISNGISAKYYAREHVSGSTYAYSSDPIFEYQIKSLNSNEKLTFTCSLTDSVADSSISRSHISTISSQ